jgi:hypothetical protein
MIHGQADEVAREIRRLNTRPESAATPPAASTGDDPIAQLEKLAALRDRGIISPKEFDAKKSELMGRI